MEELIKTFYTAFNNLDSDTMVACYHKNIVFEDPAFGILKGVHAGNMWHMLCEAQKNATDFKVTFSGINAEDLKGNVKWEAHYTFSKTKRKVHNVISAEFEFKDGKIIKHTDYFNLRTWAQQALGFKGYLLGGTLFFKNKLNHQTNSLLAKFEKNL